MAAEDLQRPAEPALDPATRRRGLFWLGIGAYLLLANTWNLPDPRSDAVLLTGFMLLVGILFMATGVRLLLAAQFPLPAFVKKTEWFFWLAAILFQFFREGGSIPDPWLRLPGSGSNEWGLLVIILACEGLILLALAGRTERERWWKVLAGFVRMRSAGAFSPAQRPALHSGLLLIAQALALLLANQALQRALSPKDGRVSAAMWLYASLLLLMALYSVFSAAPWRYWHTRGVRMVSLFSALALAYLSARASGAGGSMLQPAVAMLGWAGAIGLVVWSGWQPPAGRGPVPRRVWLTASALFLAALLLLRLVHLSDIPVQLSGDEARFGFSGLDYMSGRIDNPFSLQVFLHPGLFSFAQSWMIRLFGRSELALRLLPALVGSLGVPALYLMGRTLFDERAGLFAGLYLAAFHFHVHFSRLGLNQIFDALAFTAVLAALYVGWKQNRRSAYLLAGLGLGLAQYFYVTARALPALVLLWLLLNGGRDFQRLKRSWEHLLWMLAAALVTYLPLLWIALHRFNDYMGPVNAKIQSGISTENTLVSLSANALDLLRRVGLGLMAYTVTPTRNWYEPGTPLLRLLPALLFLMGLGLLAVRWKDGRFSLVALWLLVFGAIGGLSENTPSAQRYPAVAPALALVVGYSLSELAKLGRSLWPQRRRRIEAMILALALLACLDEPLFYFQHYTPRSISHDLVGLKYYRIAKDLQSEPPGRQVYFFGAPRTYDSIAATPFLTPNVRATSMRAGWPLTGRLGLPGRPVVFVFLDDHSADLQIIRALYPGGELLRRTLPNGDLLYWIYRYNPT